MQFIPDFNEEQSFLAVKFFCISICIEMSEFLVIVKGFLSSSFFDVQFHITYLQGRIGQSISFLLLRAKVLSSQDSWVYSILSGYWCKFLRFREKRNRSIVSHCIFLMRFLYIMSKLCRNFIPKNNFFFFKECSRIKYCALNYFRDRNTNADDKSCVQKQRGFLLSGALKRTATKDRKVTCTCILTAPSWEK